MGLHERLPEFPIVTRESCRNSKKSMRFPHHHEIRPFLLQLLKRNLPSLLKYDMVLDTLEATQKVPDTVLTREDTEFPGTT